VKVIFTPGVELKAALKNLHFTSKVYILSLQARQIKICELSVFVITFAPEKIRKSI
jgi:hypothetical protein